jgi:hypothetical protein
VSVIFCAVTETVWLASCLLGRQSGHQDGDLPYRDALCYAAYSPKCVEGGFSEVRMEDPA